MTSCTPGYAGIARTLDGGLDCTTARALVSVHRPWELTNWTLPVVEALMVLLAIAALVHAVLRWRRRGDPVNVGLWCASVVYVLVLEPPLYFPDQFGIQEQTGLIFVHNQFSVQFLYDRLPLYILALYPAMTYLAFAVVQATGVLERVRPWAGAACVAFTFHCFYEIFDQLGPQLQWWAWNPAAPSNSPLLGSAPLTSAAIFAGASPFGFALLTQLLIARRAAHGPVPWTSMLVRVLAVGALTPLFMVVFAIPYGIASAGEQPLAPLQAASLWVVIAGIAGVAAVAFGKVTGAASPISAPARTAPARTALIGGTIYLGGFALLWAGALPDYLAASGGKTAGGTPIGSLFYVMLCAAGCLVVLGLAARNARSGRSAIQPASLVSPAPTG